MELYVNVQHTNNNPNMITKNQMYYNNIMHETLDNDKQLIHIEWHSPVQNEKVLPPNFYHKPPTSSEG